MKVDFVSCTCPCAPVGSDNDFDQLNELVQNAVVLLPDARIKTGAISLRLTHIQCTAFAIQNVVLTTTTTTTNSQTTTNPNDLAHFLWQLEVQGLDMTCSMDYKYTFLFTRRGSAVVDSTAHASIVAAVSQPRHHDIFGTSLSSPATTTTSTVQRCNPVVEIGEVDFAGDISAVVLDAVGGMVQKRIETEAEQRICDELRAWMTTDVAKLRETFHAHLAQYPPLTVNQTVWDPVRAEDGLVESGDSEILNLLDRKTAVAQWFDRILQQAVDHVSKPVHDDDDEKALTVGTDNMKLNALIRDNFLDENRALVLNITADPRLFYRHDRVTEMSVVLHSIQILGLDTVTTLNHPHSENLRK